MKIKKIWQRIGIAVIAFTLGTVAYSQPVVTTATIHSAKITVTAAELAALNTNSVVVVTFPPENDIIVPIGSAIVTYNAGTDGYTYTGGNGQLTISWGGNYANAGGFAFAAELLSSTGPAKVPFLVYPSSSAFLNTQFPGNTNAPLVLTTDGGVLSGGNGTLTIEILYYNAGV